MYSGNFPPLPLLYPWVFLPFRHSSTSTHTSHLSTTTPLSCSRVLLRTTRSSSVHWRRVTRTGYVLSLNSFSRSLLTASPSIAALPLPSPTLSSYMSSLLPYVLSIYISQTHNINTQPGITQRFELFICGHEVCNSYTELNDPDEQRARMHAQRAHVVEVRHLPFCDFCPLPLPLLPFASIRSSLLPIYLSPTSLPSGFPACRSPRAGRRPIHFHQRRVL